MEIPFAISIVFSLIALILSVFTFLDNRKKTRIMTEREEERRDIQTTTEILREASKHFKNLSNLLWDPLLCQAVDDINREISEKDQVKLKSEYKWVRLDVDKKYPIDMIENSRWLRDKIESPLLALFKGESNLHPNPVLEFNVDPNIILNPFFELGDYFEDIVKIKYFCMRLQNYAEIIDSLDNEILSEIEQIYQEIFNAFYDGIKKKTYEFEFNRKMKASEIETELYKLVNFDIMKNRTEYLAKNITPRLENLISRLFEYSLAK